MLAPFGGALYHIILEAFEQFTFQLVTVHFSALNSSLFNFE
jgi:hypothetical protein